MLLRRFTTVIISKKKLLFCLNSTIQKASYNNLLKQVLLKEDFQKKIDEAKIQANQKISESKKNVDIALSNYEKELEDKYSQKKLDFQEELASLQNEEIQQIQQVFEANRQELVQETIKEVLKRYGNC